jgi:hypothetical protein
MSVSSIGSAQTDPSVLAAQQAEQAEAKTASGRDVKNDHDGDDNGAAASSGPSLNLNGQTVGTIISKTA